MSKTFGLLLVATAVAFGLTVMAAERPTQEHQDIMKSNAAITSATGLRAHVTAKDDAGITQAQRAFAPLCLNCHQTHRLIIPAENRYEIQ